MCNTPRPVPRSGNTIPAAYKDSFGNKTEILPLESVPEPLVYSVIWRNGQTVWKLSAGHHSRSHQTLAPTF